LDTGELLQAYSVIDVVRVALERCIPESCGVIEALLLGRDAGEKVKLAERCWDASVW
jgi:hypothetical protein